MVFLSVRRTDCGKVLTSCKLERAERWFLGLLLLVGLMPRRLAGPQVGWNPEPLCANPAPLKRTAFLEEAHTRSPSYCSLCDWPRGQEMEEAGGVGLHPGPSEVASGHISLLQPGPPGLEFCPVPPHCVLMASGTFFAAHLCLYFPNPLTPYIVFLIPSYPEYLPEHQGPHN